MQDSIYADTFLPNCLWYTTDMGRMKVSPGSRAGYLLEFPLMAFGSGILAGILSPLLPEPWNLVPWAAFVIALVAWFLYDRFCPGWRPKSD